MAQHNYPTYEQDANAHVKYSVSWADWLDEHGFTPAQVESFTWVTDAGVSTTHTSVASSIASVWIRSVQVGRAYRVTCRISCPEPTSGAGSIKDDFTFVVRGVEL
jgi:hypothetical protein